MTDLTAIRADMRDPVWPHEWQPLIAQVREGQPVTLDQMQRILRMLRDGDLIHVDEIGDVLADYKRKGIDAP